MPEAICHSYIWPEQRCDGLVMSLKKVQRTQDLELAGERELIAEAAQNRTEDYNFKKLVKLGIIREENDH